MVKFSDKTLRSEEAFWVMRYFLEAHYQLSNGQFSLSDILSTTEPMDWVGSGEKLPADTSMIAYWEEALAQFEKEGLPQGLWSW